MLIAGKENGHDVLANDQQLPVVIFKMCTMIFEILSLLCIESSNGHEVILQVLSEIKGEKYRFERLLQSLHEIKNYSSNKKKASENRISKLSSIIEEQHDLILFDCVAAALELFNSIIQTPDSVEKRVSLRTEFERRGMDACLEDLLEQKDVLPERLQKQLDIYFRQRKLDKDQIHQMENVKRQSILNL